MKLNHELILFTKVSVIQTSRAVKNGDCEYPKWEKENIMNKKTLIALLLLLAATLFVYVLTTFVVGQLAAPTEPVLLVNVHKFFLDQYNFITDHFAFLIVLLVFLAILIAIGVKYLVPKKIGSKKDTRYGVKLNQTKKIRK